MLCLGTEYINFSINQRVSTFPVHPLGSEWTVLSYCTFINDLSDIFQIKNYLRKHETYWTYTIANTHDDDSYFITHIDGNMQISTRFSIKFLECHFEKINRYGQLRNDNRGRPYDTIKVFILTQYRYQLRAEKATTKTFVTHHSFLFFNIDDFSKPFIYFVKKFYPIIERNNVNAFIFAFYDEFLYIEKAMP